jgi:hypothetical protein
MLPGVYMAVKKNGEVYYRASITYNGKHISLGSYSMEEDAHQAYLLAGTILNPCSGYSIDNYPASCILSFDKWVVLINFKDHNIYFKNPIYLKKRYFYYYLSPEHCLKFDAEDLFYYAHRKIIKRGGHLFVNDYGMQVNIFSRYGIKNYAVAERDYLFVNGDSNDFRYHNIEIINRYHGVSNIKHKGQSIYLTKIHMNGDYLVGRFPTETEAAIAYNKAALLLKNSGVNKAFPHNYIEQLDEITYASLFQKLRISKKLIAYAEKLRLTHT